MIGCPVKVLQDPQELEAILKMYQKLRPKKVLEIGSLYGGTLWHWIQNSEPGTVIVSVDMIPNNKAHRASRVLESRKLWDGWAETARVELVPIIGSSTSLMVMESVRFYQPFDFIFVDGGHDYKTVHSDYGNYYPMLRKGGLMAFHDIAALPENVHNIEVGLWWREMTRRGWFDGKIMESITKRRNWGIGIIEK